jgi:hypothetical protein
LEVKRPWLQVVIAVNLIVLIALAFIYPHLMISPGPLASGHAALATDCFACHAPWRGATSDRCIVCHALPDIGLRTTKGAALPQRDRKTSFHQELIEQDCMACHSDHAGPKLTQRSRRPFSHALLHAAVRDKCEACHAAPTNEVHRDLSVNCGQCHKPQAWKPASFDHALLTKAALAQCAGCHKAPTDALHKQIQGNCGQCHGSQAWKPATFEHGKFFVLDRNHNTTCVTCHASNDYKRYTCYGCHEHQPAKVRAEHEEEGIRDFEDCVKCHRSADKESAERASRTDRKRD